MSPMYDVPPLGEPFALRGARDVAVVLDEFTPTHLDAWLGRAVRGDEAPARALVVRHAGDVVRRGLGLRGRARLAAVAASAPPDEPLLGIVVETTGAELLWLPRKAPATLAVELSRREWRSFPPG